MTVKELIEILSGYPQDATVEIENECGSHVEPTPVGIAYSLSDRNRAAQLSLGGPLSTARAEF